MLGFSVNELPQIQVDSASKTLNLFIPFYTLYDLASKWNYDLEEILFKNSRTHPAYALDCKVLHGELGLFKWSSSDVGVFSLIWVLGNISFEVPTNLELVLVINFTLLDASGLIRRAPYQSATTWRQHICLRIPSCILWVTLCLKIFQIYLGCI